MKKLDEEQRFREERVAERDGAREPRTPQDRSRRDLAGRNAFKLSLADRGAAVADEDATDTGEPFDPAALSQLAAAARRETPGWWRGGARERDRVFCQHDDGIAPPLGRVLLRMNTHFPHEATAAYIGACPPAVPLALLERIDELELALRRVCDDATKPRQADDRVLRAALEVLARGIRP